MNFLGFSDELKSNWVFRKSPQRIKQAFHLLMATACLLLLPRLLLAHEIRPAIATFAMQSSGNYSITISLNLEAILSGIGAEHEDTEQVTRGFLFQIRILQMGCENLGLLGSSALERPSKSSSGLLIRSAQQVYECMNQYIHAPLAGTPHAVRSSSSRHVSM